MLTQIDESPDHCLRLTRATQSIRVHQSSTSLPLFLLGAVVFIVVMWDEAPRLQLVTWLVLCFLATLVRSIVCARITPKIESASTSELDRFEHWLFWTAIANSSAIGSGFWWIGIEGTDRLVTALTLVSCMYAIGAMINASVHFSSFVLSISANLGQGIVFLGIIRSEWYLLFSSIVTYLLLILFGKQNSRTFADSIRIRAENVFLVDQLAGEKQVVETALAAAKQANQSKNQFLASASHDLRQPLHALSLFFWSASIGRGWK